jgi:hypothetical protein
LADLTTKDGDTLIGRECGVDGAKPCLVTAALEIERSTPHVFDVLEVVVDGSKRNAGPVRDGLGGRSHLTFCDELKKCLEDFGLCALAAESATIDGGV